MAIILDCLHMFGIDQLNYLYASGILGLGYYGQIKNNDRLILNKIMLFTTYLWYLYLYI